MSERKLTPKQKRFVAEFLVDLNGTQAAIRAGYSPRTATVIAAENLTKPNIAAAVANAQAARSARTQVDQDWVILRLKEEAGLIGEGSSHSARVAALKLLGQHLGMFTQKMEHSGHMTHEHTAGEETLREFRRRYGALRAEDEAAVALPAVAR